jgi:hypothetical protein
VLMAFPLLRWAATLVQSLFLRLQATPRLHRQANARRLEILATPLSVAARVVLPPVLRQRVSPEALSVEEKRPTPSPLRSSQLGTKV